MKTNIQLLEEYNDHLASVYDAATTSTDSSWTAPKETSRLILPYVKSGTKILDIGIGTGQSAEALAQAGGLIAGIDVSSRMLEITKEKHPDWDLYYADLETNFPAFSPEYFEVVIACGVFEFIENIEKIFTQVHSTLTNKGIFCFTYEEYLPDHPLQKEKCSKLGKGIVEPIPERMAFHVFRRTVEEVQQLLSATGFILKTSRQFTSYYKSEGKIPVVYQIVLAEKL